MSIARFLDPTALKRVHRLDIRAKYIVEGFLAGMHRSPHFGQSVEFLQHRQYAWGDDLRNIDWKVWGKQDRLYVKQYEEETNLRALLLVDSSSSMFYDPRSGISGRNVAKKRGEVLSEGSGEGEKSQLRMSKYEYSATLAVSLAYMLLKQQDAVGCVRFSDKIHFTAPQQTRRNHLNSIIQSLDIMTPDSHDGTGILGDSGTSGTTAVNTNSQEIKLCDPGSVLREITEAYGRRGLIIILSDFLVARPGLFNGLKMLRSRGHDVMLFHVLDDDELDFPFSGPSRFEGLEFHEVLRCNPRALRNGYLEALNTYLEEMRKGCVAQRVDYVLARTSAPFNEVLTQMILSRR